MCSCYLQSLGSFPLAKFGICERTVKVTHSKPRESPFACFYALKKVTQLLLKTRKNMQRYDLRYPKQSSISCKWWLSCTEVMGTMRQYWRVFLVRGYEKLRRQCWAIVSRSRHAWPHAAFISSHSTCCKRYKWEPRRASPYSFHLCKSKDPLVCKGQWGQSFVCILHSEMKQTFKWLPRPLMIKSRYMHKDNSLYLHRR